ncbi:hypothetical protein [Methylobacterium brachiatum]|uniref:hypothetical protein n=1 Tax=Methylobacterium brachiatum TaxID=269660 RepID=UPI0024486379|nr:hypothetical protein [Methylobacterium brachiatum]MDH2312335.1 hypothetical protein [Methylobacterium brachiatum]
MRTRYFDRIPLDDYDTLFLIREAALRILLRHGRPTVDEQGAMLVAKVDGYTFRYYSMTPDAGTIPELPPMLPDDEFGWPSSMHCIDVEASELLFGLAIDADGLSHRCIVRGPWEYEITRAAGLEKHFHHGLPLPPCSPESRCRMFLPLKALRLVKKWQLRMPVRFSVAGYTRCMDGLLPPGSGFHDIMAAIDRSYRESRSYDCGHDVGDGAAMSSFGIWGWAGDRPVRRGRRMKKPDIAYWISPTGGCEAAAALLLLLDKERSVMRSPLAAARSVRSATASPSPAA